jgi:hypothetical protein
MTDDKTFAHQLRACVDRAAPTIDVDTEAVLPRARRLRARRRAAAGVACVGAVAIAAGWVAQAQPWTPTTTEIAPAAPTASSVPADPTPVSAPDETAAVIDVEAGTIALPIDDWAWSAEDYALSRTAVTHYVVGCLQEAGYEAAFLGPVPPDPDRDAAYGVWRTEDAETLGYQTLFPPLEAEIADAGSAWDPESVPRGVAQGCYQEAQDAGLTYDVLDFEVGAHPEAPKRGIAQTLSSDAARSIRAEWRECLTNQGVIVPQSAEAGMVPDGVFGMPVEEQIRIAALDVECKRELGTTQRLADLDAAAQTTYIEENRSYLADRRAVEDAVLDRAREYLDEHGVEMP